jgi:hypothetical protein
MARYTVERVEDYIFKRCNLKKGERLFIRIERLYIGSFALSDLAAARLKRDVLLAQRELMNSYSYLARHDEREVKVKVKPKPVKASPIAPAVIIEPAPPLPVAVNEAIATLPVASSPVKVRTDKKDGVYCLNGQYQTVLNGRVFVANSAEEATAIYTRRGVKNPCGKNTVSDYKPLYDLDRQLEKPPYRMQL